MAPKTKIQEEYYGVDISEMGIPDEWKESEADFVDVTKKVPSCGNLTPSSLRVNTMTLVTHLGECTVDLEALMRMLNDVAPGSASFPKKRASNKEEGLKVEGKRFYNSVSWKMAVKDGGSIFKVSAMFFPNGRIKFAGCKTVKCCALLPGMIVNYIRKEKPDIIKGVGSDKLRSGIEMVNSDFHMFNQKTDKLVAQKALQMCMYRGNLVSNGGQIRSAEYNPDKYPAVNIKFKPKDIDNGDVSKDITICVFNPGSVIVTGKKSFRHIKEGCEYITNVMNKDVATIVYNRPEFQKVSSRAVKKHIKEDHFHIISLGA